MKVFFRGEGELKIFSDEEKVMRIHYQKNGSKIIADFFRQKRVDTKRNLRTLGMKEEQQK